MAVAPPVAGPLAVGPPVVGPLVVGPLVVGLGGSARSDSLTDQLLRDVLERATARGARTVAFLGEQLAALPIYSPQEDAEAAVELARTVALADALVLATPGYHGAISGLLKNALDHLEILRGDARPYLDGRAVGILVAASGWQACGSALSSVRAIVHALRGWPTPFGAAVNSTEPVYGAQGRLVDRIDGALQILADQVMDFVGWRRGS